MFPKAGRKIPAAAPREPLDYAAAIAEALRADLGSSHQAIKTLMRWTAANERTVKNWLSGANGPSGEHLLEIIRNSDLAFECVLRLPLQEGRSKNLLLRGAVRERRKSAIEYREEPEARDGSGI